MGQNQKGEGPIECHEFHSAYSCSPITKQQEMRLGISQQRKGHQDQYQLPVACDLKLVAANSTAEIFSKFRGLKVELKAKKHVSVEMVSIERLYWTY